MKIVVFIAVLFILLAGGVIFFTQEDTNTTATITTFEECIAAGNPVLESYPAQCRTPEGATFVQDIGNELEKRDLIRITSPRPSAVIESPIEITGEARGPWYFEASFPITLLDENGVILAQIPAQALDEWMTEEFVPFRATLEFDTPETRRGSLVLEKDNPSGLPEHDDELIVPIFFSDSEE